MRRTRLALLLIVIGALVAAPGAGSAAGSVAGSAAGSVAGSAAGTAQTQARAALPSWRPFDFNGDGYRDLAVGSIGAFKAGKPYAGAVTVLYGARTGLSPTRRQTIHQGLSWVPDTAEAHDEFGSAIASGNFDGDAYADLAIGSEGEQLPSSVSGSVTLLFGGPAGFASGVRYVTPPNDGGCNTFGGIVTSGDFNADGYSEVVASSYCNAGIYVIRGGANARAGGLAMQNIDTGTGPDVNYGLAAGDVNGDGYDDLAETDYRGDPVLAPAGRLLLHVGGPAGLTSAASQQVGDAFSVTIGDFDGDGFGDVASGSWWGPAGQPQPGHVNVWYGTSTGLDLARGVQTITQDTPGVPGTAETADNFGVSVAAGDINRDGSSELAVGVPGESISGRTSAGLVTVLYGGLGGLSGAGAQQFHKNTPGIPGAIGAWDLFGSPLALLDVNGDARADLIAAAPADGSEGLVTILRAARLALTTNGAMTIGGNGVGLTGSGPGFGSSAYFGWSLGQ